jgi:phage tail-like protein
MTGQTQTLSELEDPALVFNFAMEIDGIIEGFFMECSGLKSERKVEEFKEGGENGFVHKFPGQISFSNIVLKRGVTASNELLAWYLEGRDTGRVSRRKVSIMLLNGRGETLKAWHAEAAFPAKWSGPELKSDSSQVMVETLELAHHGLSLAK